MKVWDGYDKTGRFHYDTSSNDFFTLYIDNDGNIYYNSLEDASMRLWCPAERLTAHLHHLEQIKAR